MEYTSRFECSVAPYVTHSGHTEDKYGKQWVILLIKNYLVTADTNNSITFQLTVNAGRKINMDKPTSLRINRIQNENMLLLHSVLAEDQDKEVSEPGILELDLIKKSPIRQLETKDDRRAQITLEDAICAIRQVKIAAEDINTKTIGTMAWEEEFL